MVRWLFSTNAKDLGVLYLIFALFAGMIGTAFYVLILLELAAPSNLSYLWNYGSLLGLYLVIQIITGVTLAIKCVATLGALPLSKINYLSKGPYCLSINLKQPK